MIRRAFNITKTGASHIRKNIVCQDFSAKHEDENLMYIIVSDGHGGDDYVRSDIGSRFAVEAAQQCVEIFAKDVDFEQFRKKSSGMLGQLSKSIISAWYDKIGGHFSQVALTEKESSKLSNKATNRLGKGCFATLYGATLLLAVVTDNYWFGLQIGDGKCVVKEYDGTFVQPIPEDEKCFLNSTTSICDSNAYDNFRYYFDEKIPAAIFIGSDGIDNCFANDVGLNSLYDAIIASFANMEFDRALAELEEYIPQLSSKGSCDDMSIAGIMDMEKIHDYVNHAFDENEEQIDHAIDTEVEN